jgi:hypothetical protein
MDDTGHQNSSKPLGHPAFWVLGGVLTFGIWASKELFAEASRLLLVIASPFLGYLLYLIWQRMEDSRRSVWHSAMKIRFSIRDLLWLTLVVGLYLGWRLDHRRNEPPKQSIIDGVQSNECLVHDTERDYFWIYKVESHMVVTAEQAKDWLRKNRAKNP